MEGTKVTHSKPADEPVSLLAGLADLAPGPKLAAALASIDLGGLDDGDVVAVLQAEYRQSAHQRARLLAAVYETGARSVGPCKSWSQAWEFADDEVRAALGLTRTAAGKLFGLARDLHERLPVLVTAMEAGDLDEPRAFVLADWTRDLPATLAAHVCQQLLPRCAPVAEGEEREQLTTGQLIGEVKKLAIALDPQWARRRYESALRERKVFGTARPDGTADLTGQALPPERVAAACGRLDALARTAKRAGDPRKIDHLRADLFLGMTDGTYEGLTDAQILDHLSATRPDTDAKGAAAAAPAPGRPGPSKVGVELRVRLSTILGLDRLPGELAGWGPVHAELARDLTTDLVAGQWRYALTDENGRLIHAGLVAARPAGAGSRAAHSKAIVELQIPHALLTQLTEHSKDGDANDPGRRFPGAALRRQIQIRTPRCVFTGCRVPARTSDLDHRLEHNAGGPSTEENLDPRCRHDHRLRHDGGWGVDRTETAHLWTSPLGRTYAVPIRPILDDLPDPRPGLTPDPPPEPEPPPIMGLDPAQRRRRRPMTWPFGTGSPPESDTDPPPF